MKKILMLLLCFLMAFAVVGCGLSGQDNDNGDYSNTEQPDDGNEDDGGNTEQPDGGNEDDGGNTEQPDGGNEDDGGNDNQGGNEDVGGDNENESPVKPPVVDGDNELPLLPVDWTTSF